MLRRPAALPALLCALRLYAQQNDVPLNRDIYYDIDRNGACIGSTMHTGLRPLIESRADLTNVIGFRPDTMRHYYYITRKIFTQHFIQVKEPGFRLTIDPVFRFELGRDFSERGVANENRAQINNNTRGFWIRCDLGNTVSFQTSFYENQATLPLYLYQYAQGTGVIPGQGRVKDFQARGFDFAWAQGNVSWTPKRWLNIQFGNGRHFVGHGYRSMLLSDNTFPYPYLKFSALTNDQRLQYTTINAKLQSAGDPADRLPTGESSESLFYWRRASFKHASVNLGRLQLGLFEATLFRNIDSSGVRPLDPLELNPVIGLNTLLRGFGGDDGKRLLGLDAKFRLTDKVFAYGQYALDDPARQRYAWQAGLQWFDLLRRDLHLLVEYNSATPFAYTSARARGGYGHYDQPLAHPMGAGVDEAVAIVDYGIRQRWWIRAQVSSAVYRADTSAATASGGDVFGADAPFGPDSLSLQRRRTWLDLSFAWRINQMSNAQLAIGFIARDVTSAPDPQQSHLLYVSFRTGLFNRYYDL